LEHNPIYIALAVGKFAWFMENPGHIHQEAVKCVLRYLKGMGDWKLVYGGEAHGLVGFADADGAMQKHRQEISGYGILINGGAIS
jgi:hypothetical protein